MKPPEVGAGRHFVELTILRLNPSPEAYRFGYLVVAEAALTNKPSIPAQRYQQAKEPQAGQRIHFAGGGTVAVIGELV
jgi:hypothetical protein